VTALHAVPDLPDADLDALEQAVDNGLATAIDALAALRRRQAHTDRGYGTWGEYLVARFGDALRRLRLDREDHLAVVDYLARPHGEDGRPTPVRQIADALGIAVNTVQGHREALGLRVVKDKPEPPPAPEGKVWQQAAEHLARAGDRGLTLLELAGKASWSEGKASGALSYLWARYAADKSDQIRARQTAYVLTDIGYVTKRWQQ
jgi:hypothetical protein